MNTIMKTKLNRHRFLLHQQRAEADYRFSTHVDRGVLRPLLVAAELRQSSKQPRSLWNLPQNWYFVIYMTHINYFYYHSIIKTERIFSFNVLF